MIIQFCYIIATMHDGTKFNNFYFLAKKCFKVIPNYIQKFLQFILFFYYNDAYTYMYICIYLNNFQTKPYVLNISYGTSICLFAGILVQKLRYIIKFVHTIICLFELFCMNRNLIQEHFIIM